MQFPLLTKAYKQHNESMMKTDLIKPNEQNEYKADEAWQLPCLV